MGYDENVLSIIQSKLNTIAGDGFPTKFDGELSFYDKEWIEKKIDGINVKEITPFTLVVEDISYSSGAKPIITNQYSIAFLCNSTYRQEYDNVFDLLIKDLTDFSISYGDDTYFFTPNGKEAGVDFNNGNGVKGKSFEYILRFNVDVFSVPFGKDLEVFWFAEKLPIKSFKLTNGVASYAITSDDYQDNVNLYMNKTSLIIEAFIDSTVKGHFLSINTRVNIYGTIIISLGGSTIYNGKARFDGFEMGAEYSDVLTANLYFTIKNEPTPNITTIQIDAIDFPIIDYSIATKNITKTTTFANSNMAKDIYVGKARAYVFNVLKTTIDRTLYDKFTNVLMSDGLNVSNEYFDLEISFGNNVYNKKVILIDISDESSNKGVWKITMSEGEMI